MRKIKLQLVIITRIIFMAICKILYDIQIILLLPEDYFLGVSFNKDFNFALYAFGWLVFLVFSLILSKLVYKINFSSVVFISLFLFDFLPNISMIGLNKISFGFLFNYIAYWSIYFVIFNYIYYFNIYIKRFSVKRSKLLFLFLLLLLSFVEIIFVYKYNHFKVSFRLQDVYIFRAAALKIPPVISWLKVPLGTLVFPFLATYCLCRKRIFIYIFLLINEILLFSIGMDKGYLFNFAIGSACGFLKLDSKFFIIKISALLALGFFISLLEYCLLGSNSIFYLIIRRLLFLPAWLNNVYYDFFQNNPKFFLSDNVFLISRFLPKVYTENYLDLLNKEKFYGLVPAPNTGTFGISYMQLGVFGNIIQPFIHSLWSKIGDYFFEGYSNNEKVCIGIIVSKAILNISIVSRHSFFLYTISFILFYLLGYSNLRKKRD